MPPRSALERSRSPLRSRRLVVAVSIAGVSVIAAIAIIFSLTRSSIVFDDGHFRDCGDKIGAIRTLEMIAQKDFGGHVMDAEASDIIVIVSGRDREELKKKIT